jgi:hypothetical protein
MIFKRERKIDSQGQEFKNETTAPLLIGFERRTGLWL